MTSPFQRALASAGTTLELVHSEATQEVDKVRDTSELQRILALPKRPPGQTASGLTAEELVPLLTKEFRAPYGEMTLRPLQALALAELYEQRALVGQLLVGEGKTLVSYLAPVVMQAKRPLLIPPGALVGKTRREFRELRKHWEGPHPDAYPIASYQFLAHPSNGRDMDGSREDWLFRQNPDLIILDEAHKAKNQRSITYKRIARFLKEHRVPVVILTGTLYRRSIRDCAHLLEWALHERSPMPRKHNDIDYWSRALDPHVAQRIRPGALARLSSEPLPPGEEGTEALREAFRSRLATTPGFVSSQSKGLDVSLVISQHEPERECSIITNAFQKLKDEWTSPAGESYADGLQVARCARQLALGLYYQWNPAPPKPWREARKAWNAWSRETLSDNGRGMDSEVQLVSALKRGLYNDQGLYDAWVREREAERERTGHQDPPTEAVWISTEAIEAVAKWLKANPNGLVFYEHAQFAARCSKELGVKMFGPGGLAPDGSFIEAHKGAALLSAPANRTGRNLQKWDTALLLCTPEEQLLGRLHREGQQSEEVRFDLYVSCKDHLSSFFNARTVDISALGQQAKLAYADITIEQEHGKRGARWL